MKKPILLLIASLIINTSFAQLTKGTWLLGGNGMYTTSKVKSNGDLLNINSQLTIEPNIGYFIISKFACGITLSGMFAKTKYPRVDGTRMIMKQQQIGAGPFARYYFLNAEKTINFFGSASTLYSINTNNSISAKGEQVYYAFGAGAEIFFNSAVGLDFLLEYNRYNSVKTDSKWSSSGVQFKIGFQFHLEKDNK